MKCKMISKGFNFSDIASGTTVAGLQPHMSVGQIERQLHLETPFRFVANAAASLV